MMMEMTPRTSAPSSRGCMSTCSMLATVLGLDSLGARRPDPILPVLQGGEQHQGTVDRCPSVIMISAMNRKPRRLHKGTTGERDPSGRPGRPGRP